MSNSSDDAVVAVNEYGEVDPFAGINEGFLGTGHSTSVELSFIAAGAILGYLAYAFGRYYWRKFDCGARLAEMMDR